MADAGPSIRAQAKKPKNQQKQVSDKSGQSKSVIKAVLANPLTVPWPSLPRHLQTTVLANLPSLVPTDISTYHTDRARCHQTDKRHRRSLVKQAEIKKGQNGEQGAIEDVRKEGEGEAVIGAAGSEALTSTSHAKKRASDGKPEEPLQKRAKSSATHPSNSQPPAVRPEKPVILSHLVFGINEVIKSLEWQTDALRLRVIKIGDALADQQKGGSRTKGSGKEGRVLLPTAPPREEDMSDEEEEEVEMLEERATQTQSAPAPPTTEAQSVNTEAAALPTTSAPLEWIVIPILSVSPISLVSPIPSYCATYNALVYQHTHISKIARSRLTAAHANEIIGDEVQEVRIIPLGKVEEELAGLAGLRRVACLAFRSSHPQIETLRKLLPKSVLHPPRHSLTLPFPTSALTITSGPTPLTTAIGSTETETKKSSKRPASAKNQNRTKADALLPHIHYAPLHVKGITTTIPADGNAKKQKRMEEVRAKRRLAKERKKLERTKPS